MVAEGCEMNTTPTGSGFGRRVVPSDARDLALVAPVTEGLLRADLSGRGDLKERIRSILLTRIDPSVAGRMPRRTLQGQVTLLVSAIATEATVQFNEARESGLR